MTLKDFILQLPEAAAHELILRLFKENKLTLAETLEMQEKLFLQEHTPPPSIEILPWEELHCYELKSHRVGKIILTTTCKPDGIKIAFKNYEIDFEKGNQINFHEWLQQQGFKAISGYYESTIEPLEL